MTQSIRNGLTAWSRGDLEQASADFDTEFEFVTSGVFPGLDRVYSGREGFRKFFADFRGAWEDISIEVEQIVAGAGQTYVAAGRFRAVARDGLVVERPVTMVVTANRNRIRRMESFASRDEAFDIAGIPPDRRPA